MNDRTPGPWLVSPIDSAASVETEEEFVDLVKDGSRPRKGARPYRVTICWLTPLFLAWQKIHPATRRETLANARLIAAAPDLLDACRAAVDRLDDLRGLWGDEGVTRTLRDRLVAAIRRAEEG